MSKEFYIAMGLAGLMFLGGVLGRIFFPSNQRPSAIERIVALEVKVEKLEENRK